MALEDEAEGLHKSVKPPDDAPSSPQKHRSQYASRLPKPRRTEFFTESLNNTTIGTPSPAPGSKATRNALRPAPGATRGLEAALKAVQARRNDLEPVLTSPSAFRKARPRARQEELPPKQESRDSDKDDDRPRTPDAAAVAHKRAGKKKKKRKMQRPDYWSKELDTPSSPPAGLLESYRQINEEEYLHSGSDEEETDDERGYFDDAEDTTGLLKSPQLENVPPKNGTSPALPRNSSRRSLTRSPRPQLSSPPRFSPPHSPRPDNTFDARSQAPEEDPHQYSSFSPPAASVKGESPLRSPTRSQAEDEADDDNTSMVSFDRFSDYGRGRSSPQLERDQARVNAAIGAETQAFRKARRRGRSGLTVENLRRQDASSGSAGSEHGSGSGSSIVSDQVLNIPQGWGRKAKRRSWMENIAEVDTTEDFKRQEHEVPVTRERGGGDILPTMESDAPQLSTATEPQDQEQEQEQDESLDVLPSVPAHSQPQQAFQKARKWGSNGESLLKALQRPESPQVRAKKAELEAAHQRERQELEKRGLTTNRLGQLRERQSLEQVGRRPASLDPEGSGYSEASTHANTAELQDASKVATGDAIKEDDEPSAGQKEAIAQNEDDARVIDLPHIHRSDSGRSLRDSGFASAANSYSSKGKAPAVDTRDVLRRLARAESQSPETNTRDKSPHKSAEPTKPKLSETGRGSSHSHSEPYRVVKDTPQPPMSVSNLKTPVVTGAWIDTPMTKALTERPRASNTASLANHHVSAKDMLFDVADIEDAKLLQQTARKLAASPLAAIIEHAKAVKAAGGEDTLQLNDASITSLEGLLANADIRPPPPEAPDQSQAVTKAEPPTKGATADALTSRLSHLRTSITEAKSGLGSLQRRLTRPDHPDADGECNEGGELHDFFLPCARCGCSSRLATTPLPAIDDDDGAGGNSLTGDWGWHWEPVAVPLPRLWRRWRGAPHAWPRPTRLGWWLLLLTIYAVAEHYVTAANSPPFYARPMFGYGVDLRPPLILAQLIARRVGLHYVWRHVWHWLCVAVRAAAAAWGFDPGIFGHPVIGPVLKPGYRWVYYDHVPLEGFEEDQTRQWGWGEGWTAEDIAYIEGRQRWKLWM